MKFDNVFTFILDYIDWYSVSLLQLTCHIG